MKLLKKVRNQSGQGMTEYIIIVALIAIAAIAAFAYFGNTVRDQTSAMTKELAGESGAGEVKKAKKAADDSAANETKEKGLNNYTE